MPETMIERVARAIYADSEFDDAWEQETDMVRNDYRGHARAAIGAMRPNLEALFREWWKMDCRFGMTETEAVQSFSARIDSALNEPPHIAVTAGVRDG